MVNQVKLFMVIILAVCGLALLVGSQTWAQGPKAQEIIYDDGEGNNNIKVQIDPEGEVTGVWFWVGELVGTEVCDPSTETPPCWVEQQPQSGIICTCVDGDGDTIDYKCSETLADNLNNPNVTLDCHDLKKAGPGSGCAMVGSTNFATRTGFVYIRN